LSEISSGFHPHQITRITQTGKTGGRSTTQEQAKRSRQWPYVSSLLSWSCLPFIDTQSA